MIKIKIGHLHSCFQDNRVLNYFDTILIRTDFETWDYCKKHNVDFLNCFYGQYSQRAKLRELIYPNIKYKHWLTIASQYSFVFLSANADIYPNRQDFTNFVKEMVNLFKPDVIGAMNECFEKRGSAEKVMETAIDVYYGTRNAGILEPKICIYNQKIKTQEEQKCVKQILNDDFIQNYVNYFGYQSLETSPAKLKEYIPLIKEKDFEPIDVEIGTTTESYSEIKNLFDINRTFGVDKVFILTPYISKDLANYDENFKKYALSINGIHKDKFKLIEYIQKYKTKEEFIIGDDDMKLEKYYYEGRLDSLIKQDKKGYGIRFLRACFGLNDSNKFDVVLTTEVEEYQSANGLLIDGKVGPETFGNMIKVADYQKYYCWVHSLWARDM